MLAETAAAQTETAEDISTEPRKKTLYDISREYSDFEELMESIEGDITADDAAAIDLWLKDLDKDRDKKLDGYGQLITNLRTRGESRIEEGKRIRRLGEIDTNKAEFLKKRIFNFFQFHRITKPVETLRFKFKKCGNGGKNPVVLSANAENNPVELPEKYRAVIYAPKLEVIREDLERRADIVKIFQILDVISQLSELDTHSVLTQKAPTEAEQKEYDALSEQLIAVGKKFIEQVQGYDHADLEALTIEKEDLDALLDGVGELGERGEHLRIS